MRKKAPLTTQQRTALYRQRMAAIGEPQPYVLAQAALGVLLEARRNGEGAGRDLLERAVESVCADPRWQRASVDGVLARFERPRKRTRRSW